MKLAEQYLNLVEAKNLTSAQQSVVDFIKHQINVDLAPYVDLNHSVRRYFTVNTHKLSDMDMRQLKSLAGTNGKTKFRMESNGGLGTAIYPL